MDLFRVRLNCVDHYQTTPTEFDPQFQQSHGSSQQKQAPQVPVIRVFGATETGQKVCAHIHGALPYLYIDYDGSTVPEEVNAYIHRLRLSIDYALAVSYRRNTYDGKAVFVAHITLVKGVPFYGYNVGYRFFLKIYILNPLYMTRLADLLLQGAIMNRVLQPYEAHLQYLLQWMCDYNLYGCGYLDSDKYKFRSPVPEWLELNNTSHHWHDRSIPPDLISDPDILPRQSHCSMELDICVQDIVNRKEIRARDIHRDFVERFNHLAPDEKLVHSMAGLWRDETRRRKMRMGITDPSSSPFPPEALVSMSAEPRNWNKGGWIHEEEYRNMVRGLIQDERKQSGEGAISFDEFVKPDPLESYVKTTLESVEDLYPENLRSSLAAEESKLEEHATNGSNELDAVVVDETSIPNFDGEEYPYDLDEKTARDIAVTQKVHKGEHFEEKHSPNGGVGVTYNDELRPDGDSYGAHFQDPHDPVDPTMSDAWVDNPATEPNGYSVDIPQDYVDELEGRQPSKRRKLIDGSSSPISGAKRAKDGLGYSKGTAPSTSAPIKFKNEAPKSHQPMSNSNSSPEKAQEDGRLSQLSQGSIKSQGLGRNNTLSFPVVKDPYNSDTALRLSQRDGLSNSQKTPRTPKHVSFDTTKESSTTPFTDQKSRSSFSADSSRGISDEIKKVAQLFEVEFELKQEAIVMLFGQPPPTADIVSATMLDYKSPPVIYQDAYYSDEKDVPERPRGYAGREFKLESNSVPFLPPFDPTGLGPASRGEKPGVVIDKAKQDLYYQRRRRACNLLNWEFASPPPLRSEVEEWLENDNKESMIADPGEVDVANIAGQLAEPKRKADLSQIDGPTQKNKHGFKFSQKKKSTSVKHETQYMSTMSLEVHVNTRNNFVPNPEEDEIACIFWCLKSDEDDFESNGLSEGTRVGILCLSERGGMAQKIAKQTALDVEEEATELDLINRIIDIVRAFDPDILTGYEVHNGSWGYLIERARLKYEYNFCNEVSRMKSHSHGRFGKEADRWGFTNTSTIRVTGRHMINIWRAMRGELNLLQYTMENVVYHLLHKRIPHYSFKDLTRWYKSGKPRDLAKTVDYFTGRVQLDLEILEVNELIARTSEQARLLGVDFFSVISRGSQYKVESLMFRIAKPENFVLVSPSRKQVGQQNALECLPLIMEPQSAFYTSPLLVLDFQSLYPSVMIAYNYCYSTCLGRIVSWRGQNKLGFKDFKREQRLLELVKDYINIAPNGIMYVKPEMRKSLLAKMLTEILETRVMVKSGMKVDKDDKTLQQLLNNRQLALKLSANVTYGYTSGSFSGRMPCSEVGDSIVQTARETLEKAIALIHNVERWGAEVVYGDTDSLFVYLKGRTKDEAFDIGNDIAKAVTNMNPRPVKLKFEKVYHPCVLLAKKRYVGFKYESKQQKEPEFDAKGIETVRRDGTPAEQKIEEKALKILFRTSDLSAVKRYFQNQCAKIMLGKISIQDFCFAREVKLGTYSDRGPPPPGALISTRRMMEDPRTEPQYGERVPYVVITGAPGARLIDRCVDPEVLLKDEGKEIDAEYYISKNIVPPLERIFNLMGANVRAWYDEMPKVQRIRNLNPSTGTGMGQGQGHGQGQGQALVAGVGVVGKKTLEAYMKSSACLVCRAKLPPPPPFAETPPLPLCATHLEQAPTTIYMLRQRLRKSEERFRRVEMVCRSCAGLACGEEVRCDSRDCPVFYTRVKVAAKVRSEQGGVGEVVKVLEEGETEGGLEW